MANPTQDDDIPSLHPSQIRNSWYTQIFGLLIVTISFGVSVYRARHLCLTHDEALTYDLYIKNRFYGLFRFDANDHVLYTICAFCSVRKFGLNEFALRLPALFGAALYLISSLLVTRRIFAGISSLGAIALLAFNPIILDYLSLARGYGLANGFLMAAMYFSIRFQDRLITDVSAGDYKIRRTANVISICLGLSVCSNLTFAIPAAALGITLILIQFHVAPERKSTRGIIVNLTLPGSILTLAMLWPFIPQFRQDLFYIGEKSIWRSLVQLTSSSLLYKQTARVGIGATNLDSATRWLGVIAAAAATTLVFLTLLPLSAMFDRKRQKDASPFYLVACTLWMSVVIYVALHLLAKTKYPVARTGIYFTPLFSLTVGLFGSVSRMKRYGSLSRHLSIGVYTAVLAAYLLQFQMRYTHYARYDAGDLEAITLISKDIARRGDTNSKQFKVGGSWIYEPTFNFYRKTLGLNNISTYKRDIPANPSDYDYFLFNPSDYPNLNYNNLEIIWRDQVSKLQVARVRH